MDVAEEVALGFGVRRRLFVKRWFPATKLSSIAGERGLTVHHTPSCQRQQGPANEDMTGMKDMWIMRIDEGLVRLKLLALHIYPCYDNYMWGTEIWCDSLSSNSSDGWCSFNTVFRFRCSVPYLFCFSKTCRKKNLIICSTHSVSCFVCTQFKIVTSNISPTKTFEVFFFF